MSTALILDDAQTAIFLRQLEEIDSQNYDVKYAKLEALELVDAKPLNPGAESYTYRQFDGRGVAQVTSNYANGSPRVDVNGLEFTSKVVGVRTSYGFNEQEARAAQMAGISLDNMRAAVARRVLNEKLNTIALLGHAEFSLNGLFKQSNTLTYTVPNGAGASPLWTLKTGDEILTDMFGIVDKIPQSTSEVERANRLLLPYTSLRLIGAKRLGSPSDKTVLQFFKEQRPEIEVRGALFLDTAGAGSTKRAMAYHASRENLEWLLPIPFESFPPERKGMEWTIDLHARAGGVVCRYPLTICYADGF